MDSIEIVFWWAKVEPGWSRDITSSWHKLQVIQVAMFGDVPSNYPL